MPRDPAHSAIDDRIRAEHMLTAARDVIAFAKGRRRGDLETDALLRRAMINAIQEIGEAANQIGPAGRAKLAGIGWTQLVGMRHRLVHGYTEINLDMVWMVATQEAAELITALEAGLVGWPLPQPPPSGAVAPPE
jgi:uncharacterized protein with HEPN domain